MKKILLPLFILLSLQISAQNFFTPRFDISSVFNFKKDSPYVAFTSDANFGFTARATPVAYFDANFHLTFPSFFKFANPDKTQRLPAEFTFLNAAITFPRMNNKNIDIALFYGNYDYLGSDTILQKTAKVRINPPEFRLYDHGRAFVPDNSIDGIGVALYGNVSNPAFYLGGYTYWNGLLKDKAIFSGDFRFGYSVSEGAFDVFFGTKIPMNIEELSFRTGLSGILRAEEKYEFYFAFGISNIAIKAKPADLLKKIYAIFEPRIVLGNFNSSFAFFMSPVYNLPTYMTDPTLKDSTFLGLNIKLSGGNLDKHRMEGGVHVLSSINPSKPSSTSPFTLTISPFYTIALGNYLLDIRVPISPTMYKEPFNMFKLHISFKAVR